MDEINRGKWLRDFRLRKGWTLGECAKQIGVSEGTIIGIENQDRVHLSVKTLTRFSKFFHMDVVEFEKAYLEGTVSVSAESA